jgi:hexosaminidase
MSELNSITASREKAATAMYPLILTLLLALSVTSRGYAVSSLYAHGYAVLPEPQRVTIAGGEFQFGNGWRLALGSGVSATDVAVESLKNGLAERYGVTLGNGGQEPGKLIELAVEPGSVQIGNAEDKNRAALQEQAYALDLASGRIQIRANASTGLFYGVETLVQLVKRANDKLWLPAGTITDWPDLEQRNIYWDDNHHLEHLDVLTQALRQAAFYKVNGFVIKLNGHFEYDSAPAVVEPYALSPAELQELTNYGLRYHIQLIPYLDSPAHIAFILKHPEYASLREFPDSNYELCSTNPAPVRLVQEMSQDLLNANKGVKYFLLSTDEAYYVGMADNEECHSAELEKKLGSVGKVEAQFLDKTAGYLRAHGRAVIFWGEHPLKPADIPSLPSYLVNGEVYGPEFDHAFEEHGVKQMIFTSLEGVEPFFPNYYLLPPTELFHSVPMTDRLADVYSTISFNSARQDAKLIGVLVAGWGDEGLHPETFWLGYATGPSWGWHPGSPSPDEARNSFYHLFYGRGAQDMGRLYELMSTQAESWDSSWDREPSSARKPIFGYSYGIFRPRRPAHDQTLPLPPVPEGEYLRLPYDWGKLNARRVQLVENFMPANHELMGLLYNNLRSVQFNRYNLEVYLAIAGLYRQNLQMIDELNEIYKALEEAQGAAAQVRFGQAIAALDRVLDIAQRIRNQRNFALHNAVDTWYKSWFPRVEEANGRRYLFAIDDVKDHLPMRTVDMSYLTYRELLLPLGVWYDQIEAARNQYAKAHGLPARTDTLQWKIRPH